MAGPCQASLVHQILTEYINMLSKFKKSVSQIEFPQYLKNIPKQVIGLCFDFI